MEIITVPYTGVSGFPHWHTSAVILTLILFIGSTALLLIPAVSEKIRTRNGIIIMSSVFFLVLAMIVSMTIIAEGNKKEAQEESIRNAQADVDQAVTQYLSHRGIDVDQGCQETPESIFCGGQDISTMYVPLTGDAHVIITASTVTNDDDTMMTLVINSEKLTYPAPTRE